MKIRAVKELQHCNLSFLNRTYSTNFNKTLLIHFRIITVKCISNASQALVRLWMSLIYLKHFLNSI